MFPKACSSEWLQLAIVVSVLLVQGCFHSAAAQPLPSMPTNTRSPNPTVNIKYITIVRRDDRSKKPVPTSGMSPADEKRQAIEQAINDGNKARDNSEYEKALASYRRVVEELDPRDARAAYGLGNIYSDLACTDNAIKAYNEALTLKKDNRDAIIALGNAYVEKERFGEAEEQFRALLMKNSKDVQGSIGLALIAGKRKQYSEAITQLNLIGNNLSIGDKDRANAHLVLGNIFIEQKKYPEAAGEFKKVIELKNSLAVAYIKLGQTELKPAMSRYSTLVTEELTIADREKMISAARFAADSIRKAIYQYNYNHPAGYLWLAMALVSQSNYQEAENNIKIYQRKVKELEAHSAFLAANCDSGFNQLYVLGYFSLALAYNQQTLRETDPQKKEEYNNQVIDNAKEMIRVKEDHAGAYGLLSQAYLRSGKYGEALENLEKAIANETDPKSKAELYGLLGIVYSNLDRDTEAITAMKEAIRLHPESASDHFTLAGIYEKQGNFDEAIRLQKEGLAFMPQPTAASYCMIAAAYFSKARQNGNSQDYEEALSWTRKALELNPSFGSAYLLLGRIYQFYRGWDHADQAIANYEMAAKLNPKDASIYLQMGDLYYSIKHNNEAAIKYLRDAIALDPNLARAHWELGAVYRAMGNDAEAIKYFFEAIRSDRNLQDPYFSLITIYKSQRNYGEAINLINRVLEIAPKEYWPYKELAKIYEAQQKNDEAIKYYQQAIALLKPDDTFGKELYLCRIVRLQGRYPDAIGCFQKLKLPSGEDPGTILFDLGMTYVAAKNKKDALAQYEQLTQVKSVLADELLKEINR